MITRIGRYFVHEILFMVFFATILLWTYNNYWNSTHTFPSTINYLDPESDVIILTSPINKIWNNIENHLDNMIPFFPNRNDSPTLNVLDSLHSFILKNTYKDLDHPEDLEKVGIDCHRSSAISISIEEEFKLILALPVLEADTFIQTIESALEGKFSITDSLNEILVLKGIYLSALSEERILLLSNDLEHLKSRKESSRTVSRFYSNSDLEKKRFKDFKKGKSQLGWIYIKVKRKSLSKITQSDYYFPLDLFGGLILSKDLIKFEVATNVYPNNIRALKSLLTYQKSTLSQITKRISPFSFFVYCRVTRIKHSLQIVFRQIMFRVSNWIPSACQGFNILVEKGLSFTMN